MSEFHFWIFKLKLVKYLARAGACLESQQFIKSCTSMSAFCQYAMNKFFSESWTNKLMNLDFKLSNREAKEIIKYIDVLNNDALRGFLHLINIMHPNLIDICVSRIVTFGNPVQIASLLEPLNLTSANYNLIFNELARKNINLVGVRMKTGLLLGDMTNYYIGTLTKEAAEALLKKHSSYLIDSEQQALIKIINR